MKIYNCIVFAILLTVLLTLSCKDNPDSFSLSNTVKQEIDRYPQQRLIDIYKTFFQGYFGPAHLITNANSAAEYIRSEIAEANDFDSVLYHPLPPDGKFVRVNLKLIKDGKISLEDFAAAFVKSAKPVSKTDIEKWKKYWPKILTEIEKLNLNIPRFTEDKTFIEGLLAKNEYVVDHSDEFVARYRPHYRVINAEQLKILLEKTPTK
jgi:hypothetical protein